MSSDSAFDLTYDKAYNAIYELIDRLDRETAEKVAHVNFEKLMQSQKPTASQLQTLKDLANRTNVSIKLDKLTKQEANARIAELRKKAGN